MQAVLEKPLGVDETQLAPAATETVADFPKAAAETPPPLAAPKPPLNTGGVLTEAQVIAGLEPVWARPSGVTAMQVLMGAEAWCEPSPEFHADIEGVPGTGEADVTADLRTGGLITLAEVASFLDWCAERIIRYGWVQKTEVYNNRTCAIGAIRVRSEQARSTMGFARANNLYETAARYLRHHLEGQCIETWNDRPGRTMQEVVAAFREAAAMLRGVSGTYA
jgi:hypothetical protein